MRSHGSETVPLTVDNTGFLLDKLGEDCHPLQFLRELTQNSIEAILRTPEKEGEIVWDVDWLPHELGEQQPFKLCVTDNGDGMTGDEMVRYINQLSSSGSIQSVDGNYGVGAKIAAATRNHAGLVYLSWKEGQGSMIHLWRDPETGQYGLKRLRRPDGTYGSFGLVDDDVKPDLVQEHGTKIILCGMSDDQDTMKAPPEAASPSQWVAKYLNTRYFRFPAGVKVRSRQGWEQPRSNKDVNLLRTLEGQESYLQKHMEAHGTVDLTGARAHWWILRDEGALSQNTGWIESAGHCAALFKDELYDIATARSGYARLQQFGVIFGQRQVVIYVEPIPSDEQRVVTNTSRTSLLLNSAPLPWADWAAEFRESMPDEISALMERIASQASTCDNTKSIRDRLKALMDLYKVSRYRPNPDGPLQIAEPTPYTGGGRNAAVSSPVQGGGGGGGTPRPESVGNMYSVFLKKDGPDGEEVRPDLFPQVRWVSITNGTRPPGNMEDRAAQYLHDQNVLLINADFRVFNDMIQHWVSRYRQKLGDTVAPTATIADAVRGWFEQALIETVIGLKALRGSREWNDRDLEQALSEEALSAVVMQRYHPYNSVKRELGTKLGPLG